MALTAEERRRVIEMLNDMDRSTLSKVASNLAYFAEGAGKIGLDVGKKVVVDVLTNIILSDINQN
jgi:hypothetical protein